MKQITIPISDETIRSLKVGEPATLSGVMVTGRDTVHKWMMETFIKKTRAPQGDDMQVYEELKKLLNGAVIYHCGPVVSGLDTKEYKFVAAGPTTSIREEPYQADVMYGTENPEGLPECPWRIFSRHRRRGFIPRSNRDECAGRFQAGLWRA
jgi:fumarate hydratase subunit beta